jgi:crotonobetainyl-CoA:carnitine CoA-transferase CaiB-like acyl-CoA transferase
VTSGERPLPLTDVRVLDLGRVYQGPWCGLLLALAGADVNKIEEPLGEPARGRGGDAGTTIQLAMLNSNKRGITLDLKSDDGKQRFLDLVRDADVVLENFGPGTMDDLGLGAERLLEVNPRLIYGAATGYGIDGPDRDALAMDITIQAHGGVMSVTGFPDAPPVKAGVTFVDFLGGTHLYAGIVTALYERERTGLGRIVDVAMIDTIYPTHASNMGSLLRDGRTFRNGNGHGGAAVAPYEVYATSDGFVALIVITEPQWSNLCAAMGMRDLATDERFSSNGRRYHNIVELDEIIASWMAARTRAEVVTTLHAAKVPVSAVREVAELVDDRHLLERGAIQRIDHPQLGEITVPHSPLRFRGSSLAELTPSPMLGEHNAEILGP